MDTPTLLWILIALTAPAVVLMIVLLRRPQQAVDPAQLERALREEQREGRGELRGQLADSIQRTDTRLDELRAALTDDAHKSRSELAQRQQQFEENLSSRLRELGERNAQTLGELRATLTDDAHKSRSELALRQQQFEENLSTRLRELGDRNTQTLGEMRATLESQLKSLQAGNELKLEQMRATVDEKLQSTLEARLGQSFKLVSERLEAVQRGLGEMQALAVGVGDLKRVLTNVKDRGTFGETQLGALLEQILTREQYAANVATLPGSNERVEFALKLPGSADGTVWLPVDAKFPREDYERLLDAHERADAALAQQAGLALERRLRDEAKKIREKYVGPPHTTDFALLFLPTEGLYAEAIRRPGLFDALQRDHRITLVGPTTLLAVLNALQMGFRTLAIEQRSSEVWQLLGTVKTEFGKFAGVLEKAHTQLDTVQNSIKQAGVRTRAIERQLRGVEALPGGEGQGALGLDEDADSRD